MHRSGDISEERGEAPVRADVLQRQIKAAVRKARMREENFLYRASGMRTANLFFGVTLTRHLSVLVITWMKHAQVFIQESLVSLLLFSSYLFSHSLVNHSRISTPHVFQFN